MKNPKQSAASPRGRGPGMVRALAYLFGFALLALTTPWAQAQEVPIEVELRLPESLSAFEPFAVRLVARAEVPVSRGYVKLAITPGLRLLSGRLSYVGTMAPGEPIELDGVLALTSSRAVLDASAFSLADDGRIAFGRTRSLYLEREGHLLRVQRHSPESARRILRLQAIEQEMRLAATPEGRSALAEQLAEARRESYLLREAEAGCGDGCGAGTAPDEVVRLAQAIAVNQDVAVRLDESVAGHFAGFAVNSFRFTARAGDRVYLSAASSDFDPYIYLFSPSGTLLGEDDDSGGGTSARFPREQILELAQDGEYSVAVRSVPPSGTGRFVLRVVRLNEPVDSALPTLGFSANVIGPDAVELRWEGGASSGEVVIERDDGSGFVVLATVGGEQGRYLDSGLERFRGYSYRLRWRDRDGSPAVSQETRVYTSSQGELQGLADRALGDQAQTLGEGFRATGTFVYNLGTTVTAVRLAKVEIRNGPVGGSSTLLATGRTDNSGNFDIQVSSGLVQSGSVNIFARVHTVDNIGGRITITRVLDQSDNPYFFDTSRSTNFSTTTVSFGSNNAAGANANGPFLIYDAMVEGFKISQNLLNFTPPAVTTYFPERNVTHLIDDAGAFYVNRSIHINTGYGSSRDVALHEYGHYIADIGGFAQTSGGTYSLCRRASPSLAWGEGWATFFAVAGQNALGRNDTRMESTNPSNQFSYDLEAGHTAGSGVSLSNTDLGDDNPCSVSFALWDLYDSAQDSLPVAGSGVTDQVAAGFAEVTAVAASGVRLTSGLTRISLVEMYYDAWFQRRFEIETSLSATKVQNIFRDQSMNYQVPPAAASGLAATASTATAIQLRWQDNSNNETGFRIERRSGTSGSFQFVTNAAANATTYSDSGRTSGVTYTYRVQAFTRNQVRVAADLPIRWSNEASATPTGTPLDLTPISLGQTISGTLTTSDGQSTLRPGRYAKRYRLRIDTRTAVTITLTSSQFDTYLFLLDSTGRVIQSNDDAGGSLGLNSRIATTLNSGDYTIEVTTFSSGATGAFTLAVTGTGITTTPISLGQTVSGSLSSTDPISSLRSGSYADRYSFTLSSTTSVVIGMGSSNFDTYLYLLDASGSVLAQDDDSGDGTNSRISRSLNAGSYFIEATSYSSRATGNYTLSLTQAGTTVGIIDITVPTPSPISGTLATSDPIGSCRSGSFADRYRFALSARTSLRISLSSSQFDPYLCLFDSGGNRIASDDDSGGGLNSLIVTTVNAGTYIIEATSYGPGSTGSYTLTVQSSTTGGTGLPTPIALGQTISAGLSTSDANSRLRSGAYADLYSFSLSAQSSVIISMNSSAFDTYVYLFRASGTLVAQDDDGGAGTNSLIAVSLAAGDYVIEATSFSSGRTGSYTISLTGATITVQPISVGQTVSGTLSTGDGTSTCRSGSLADRYSLSISQTAGVIITMSSSSFDSYLCLFDSTGRLINQDDDSGGGVTARIVATLTAGTYTIQATSYFSGSTGSYTLSVAAATSGQITTINLGQTVSGSLSSTDALSTRRQGAFADRYRLTLSQSTSVVIEITACQFDSYLYLLSSTGTLLSQDDDGGSGLCSRIATTLAAGTFDIEVTSFSSGATGSYTLSVTQPTTAAPTPISLGQTVSGSLASTDARAQCRTGSFADRYSLTLSASTPVTISMSSSAFDTYLCLFTSAGTLITQDDDSGGGLNSRIARTLSAGTYIIEATSYGSSATGSYSLSVQQAGSGSGTTITVGQTLSGILSSSDPTASCRPGSFADRYTFTLSAQTAIVITMVSNQFDTYLCLLDSTGRLLAQDDDSGGGFNSRIAQTLQAGSYIIEATSYGSSTTGGYSVSLQSGTGGGGTATPISVGQTVTGSLSSTDASSICRLGSFADRYTFTVTTTMTGTIDLSSSAFDTYLCLFDSSNMLLAQDDDSGGGLNSRLSGTLAPGTYFIEATSYSSGATGTYTLSLQGTSGGGGGGTVTTISLGQTVTGNLSSTSPASSCRTGTRAERYTFTLGATTAVDITMTSTAFDTYLCLFNSANVLVNSNDDISFPSNLNSRISTTLSSGSYFIEATSFDSSASGSFTLSLQSGAGGGGITPTPISVGQTLSGTLATSDPPSSCRSGVFSDRYSLSLTASTAVVITLTSSTFDTYLCLFNSANSLIASNDDAGGSLGLNSQISTTLSSGSYFIEATSYASGATGSYTLSVQAGTSGGGGGGTPGATPISLGQTVSGTLSTTDVRSRVDSTAYADNYSFSLSASTAVTITLTSTAFDTYLCLFTSTESRIECNDDISFPSNTNSRIARTLSAGSYIIEASSFASNVTGNYTLSLVQGIAASEPGTAALRLGDSVTGQLAPGDAISSCMVGVGQRHSLLVAKESAVEIRMNILQANTALCLYDNRGELLARQDVTIPGEVRITRTLRAGKYKVEAASGEVMPLVYKISAQLAGPTTLRATVPVNSKSSLPLTSGSVAQIADGQFTARGMPGNFTTSVILVNPNLSQSTVQMSFRDDHGSPLTLNFDDGTSGSFLNINLPPLGSKFLRTNGLLPTVTAGSAQVLSTLPINGSFVFAQSLGGRILSEAAVPIFEPSSSVMVPVDNSIIAGLGNFDTGLAINNTSSQNSDVQVIFRDDKGIQISETTVSLPPGGHISNSIRNLISGSRDRRGSVELRAAPGTDLVAVGIRGRLYSGTITALPVISEAGTNFFVPQLADGIDAPNNAVLQTSLIFVNPDPSSAANLAISFRDGTGAPLQLQFAGLTKDSSFNLQVPALGTLFLDSDGSSPSLVQGSAVITSDIPVNGQVIFTQSNRSDPRQFYGEAPVPLSTARREVMVPVDNSSGFASGFAVANAMSSGINVTLSMTDETGAAVGSAATVQLPSSGQTANIITAQSLIPASNGRRGTLRILAPSGSELTAIGIRGNNTSGTLTSLPVISTSTQQ